MLTVRIDRQVKLLSIKMPEDYVCETASNVKEAKKLIEAGFEYICETDGEQLFRKRK